MLLDPEWVDACSVEGKADLYRPGDKVRLVTAEILKNFPENIQEYYVMPKHLLKGANDTEVFMLRVQGQSMIEAGINDGDIIIIHRGMSVESGEIGVVRVSGESATLKRVFYENGNKIRLQPENSSMQPIIVDINDVEIVGKLIGLYREY